MALSWAKVVFSTAEQKLWQAAVISGDPACSRDPETWALPGEPAELLRASMTCVWHGQLLHTAPAWIRLSPTEFHFNVPPKTSCFKRRLKDTDTVFESKLSCKLWPWPTLPIIYRFRCPRINCGILLVFSRSVWWWQTPGGSPQIGASCPTLWTQPKQPNRRLPVVSQTSGGRLSLLHTSACLGEAPSPGQILTLHRNQPILLLKKF